MSQTRNVTQGSITSHLLHMAIPLIATSFIQTTYNLIDMIWIGRLGSHAVAAVGTAGFLINMSMALAMIIVTGTGIKVSHYFGAGAHNKIKQCITNGYIMALFIGVVYGATVIIAKKQIIGFFQLDDPWIITKAENYLVISMVATPIIYLNLLYTSIFNSFGNSRLSFKMNSAGLLVNMVLDPLLIFGIGGVAKGGDLALHGANVVEGVVAGGDIIQGFGVEGAAYASVIGRMVVLGLFVLQSQRLADFHKLPKRLDTTALKSTLKLGLPHMVQRVSFIGVSMIIARLIAQFGATGIAVQKIGIQIEAITYMTIGGLHGAVSVFIGQNYGVQDLCRIREGYKKALTISFLFGIITTAILVLVPEPIFHIFVDEPETIAMGVAYLRIIGLSQIFMCIEIVTMASFNGLGKTYVPMGVSFVFTGLRIPMAYGLALGLSLGLNGVWWSISVTSMIKGVLLVSLFFITIYGKKRLFGGNAYDSI